MCVCAAQDKIDINYCVVCAVEIAKNYPGIFFENYDDLKLEELVKLICFYIYDLYVHTLQILAAYMDELYAKGILLFQNTQILIYRVLLKQTNISLGLYNIQHLRAEMAIYAYECSLDNYERCKKGINSMKHIWDSKEYQALWNYYRGIIAQFSYEHPETSVCKFMSLSQNLGFNLSTMFLNSGLKRRIKKIRTTNCDSDTGTNTIHSKNS